MILYAVKTGNDYLHDEKDGSYSKVTLKRASVYDCLETARTIAENTEGARVVQLSLTETELGGLIFRL